MSVSIEMVKMFLSHVKKKNHYTFIRKEQENNCAEDITNHDREFYYNGSTAYEWFEKLKVENIDHQTILKIEPELLRKLPFIHSEALSRMIQKHRTEYNYTDLNEIFIQSIAAMILASCSYPDIESSSTSALSINKVLRRSNTAEFEALANTWLEFLLVCNCQSFPKNWVPKEDLQKLEEHLQDCSYYSAYRNLLFINYACQLYNNVSYNFTTNFLKSVNQNISVDEFSIHAKNYGVILKILPKVLENFVWFEDEFHQVIPRFFLHKNLLKEEKWSNLLNNNSCELPTITVQCAKETNTHEENIAHHEIHETERTEELERSEIKENSLGMC